MERQRVRKCKVFNTRNIHDLQSYFVIFQKNIGEINNEEFDTCKSSQERWQWDSRNEATTTIITTKNITHLVEDSPESFNGNYFQSNKEKKRKKSNRSKISKITTRIIRSLPSNGNRLFDYNCSKCLVEEKMFVDSVEVTYMLLRAQSKLLQSWIFAIKVEKRASEQTYQVS